jgi:Ribonuclease G/E
MMERKNLEGFYHELQTPSRMGANTRTAQVQESEEDLKSELTQP